MAIPLIFPTGGAQAQLPAFPGADGAGGYATGGRGGIVYHVTKLNSELDDPNRAAPGTFLYGLNSANFPAGPRTIVFDVAGVFHLGIMDTTNWTSGGNAWDSQSRQGISAQDLTIAGQTAPGPVIIMGGTLKFSGSNVVVRNLTVAAGYGLKAFWEPDDITPPSPGTLPTSYTMDAIEVDAQDIILDHLSAIYGSDETISCNEFADNFTVQYTINALAQNYQSHSYGHLLQPNTNHKLSYIHNLDAQIRGRLPRVGSELGTGALNDFRDNLTYNWLGGAGYAGASQYSKNNFINNFYLSGPGGDSDWESTEAGGTGIFNGASSSYTSVYPSGNLKDTNKDGDPNDTSSADGDYANSAIQPSAYDIDIGVTLTAKDSFTNILRYAGSRWWERDYDITLGNTNAINTIDERIVHDVIAGTGRIQAWADDPYNVSGTYSVQGSNEGAEWRALWALRMDTNGVAPFNRSTNWDADLDGMPDCWEAEYGLNPNVADNNGDFDSDGYSNLEEYLNDIAAWPAPGNVLFTGETNNRYALIYNWRVNGQQVNITGRGNITTFSHWQPSRYDTAVISNATVVVDAIGQHAGTLRLTNNADLDITNGWLKASSLVIGSGCHVTVQPAATLRLTGSGSITMGAGSTFTNAGVLDIITWNGTLPAGFVNAGTVLDRSVIQVSSSQVNGQDFEVTIQGYRGHGYQLQYRDDLSTGTWQDVGACVGGTDAPLTLTHVGGANGQKQFYRVAVD